MRKSLALAVALLVLSLNAAACPSDLSTLVFNGPVTMMVCPDGDGQTLADAGSVVTLTVLDEIGAPVAGLVVTDMALSEPWWGPEAQLFHCDGASAARDGFAPDAPTDAAGVTHFSGSIAAGGWSDLGLTAKLWCGDLTVVAETLGLPLPIRITSPDLNGDGVVNLFDFRQFGDAYGTEIWYCDFTRDGTVDLGDFSAFGDHYGHGCP